MTVTVVVNAATTVECAGREGWRNRSYWRIYALANLRVDEGRREEERMWIAAYLAKPLL
jgi:hypothetical protein